MERAAFLTAWREKKIKNVIMGLGAPAGNAATRIEAYVLKNGIYASAWCRRSRTSTSAQAREIDRKKREALVHQIQDIMHERVPARADLRAGLPLGHRPAGRGSVRRPHQGLLVLRAYEDLKLKR